MMLPELEKSKTYKQIDNDFTRGIWHRRGGRSGTYFAGENVCTDVHPALCARPPRRTWVNMGKTVHGMFCAGNLFVACQGELMRAMDYNRVEVIGKLSTSQKVFGSLGNQMLILPDFKVYNADTRKLKAAYVNLQLANVQVQNQDYVDEDGVARTFRFNTLSCTDFNFLDYFSPGDAVRIAGSEKNDGIYTIRSVEEYLLRFDENTFVAESIASCTISLNVPALEGLCTCGGRLWGYAGDTIYACAPERVTNWYRYDGDEQSSYTVKVPGSGPFTGCIMHGGRPVFFKTNSMVEVYGDHPRNFSVVETVLSGVMTGSAASLCSVGGDMIYLSENGVVCCSGSNATVISEPLGQRLYNGIATTDGRRYYLSAEDEQGVRALYIYDTQTEAWNQEDGEDILYLGYLNGDVYACGNDNLVAILGQNVTGHGTTHGPPSSYVELHPLMDDSKGEIVPVRLGVRVECGQNSELTLSVSYDGGAWEKRATLESEGKRLWYVPLAPRACHSLGIRIDGDGEYLLQSVIKEYK